MTPANSMTAPAVPTEAEPSTGRHIYAVVPADMRGVEDISGLDATPLRLVGRGPVAAVVNDIQLDRPPGRRGDLMAYHQAVDALAAAGPVIPVQFGSVLLDDDSVVAEVLADREAELADRLEQLAGRAQFRLRASYIEETTLRELVENDPYIAALRERTRGLPEDASYSDRVKLGEHVAQAMDETRTRDIESLLEVIAPYVVDHQVTPGSGTEGLASFSLLVDDDRAQGLETQLEKRAEAVHERIRLSLLGPMAPYDFVGGGA